MSPKTHGVGAVKLNCGDVTRWELSFLTGMPSTSAARLMIWSAWNLALARCSAAVLPRPSRSEASTLSKPTNKAVFAGIAQLRTIVPNGAARNHTFPLCLAVTSNVGLSTAGWVPPEGLVSGNSINHCHQDAVQPA